MQMRKDLEGREVLAPTVKGYHKRKVKRFSFAKEVCRASPRYEECVNDKRRRDLFITLHPDEELLQQARELEKSAYFRQRYRERMVVEHRSGRLVGLGVRARVGTLVELRCSFSCRW